MICVKCKIDKTEESYYFRKDTQKREVICVDCRYKRTRARYKELNPITRELKTLQCEKCKDSFLKNPVIDGKRLQLKNRKFCLKCEPLKWRVAEEKNKELTRTCSKCGAEKQYTFEFFRVKNKTNQCRSCDSERVIEQQKERKLRWLEYKGGKCVKCGYNKSVRSLHFHHINPKEKDFTLCQYRCRSWEQIKAELDKCEILCANCHGELHEEMNNKSKIYE